MTKAAAFQSESAAYLAGQIAALNDALVALGDLKRGCGQPDARRAVDDSIKQINYLLAPLLVNRRLRQKAVTR